MSGKILITGGLGNLGSWLTNEFCHSGYDVYVLTRNAKNKLKNIKYNIIEVDITDIDKLKEKLNMEFDYCVHTASCNEYFIDNYAKKSLEINSLGTRNLLEVLSKTNLKRFIYFSTFHVYGISSGVIKESCELNPKDDYACTHLFAEYYVKQFGITDGLNYTILRLTNSYGAPNFIDSNKWYLVLNNLTKSAYDNGEIIIKSNGKPKRDFIWMGDVAKITKQILDINENEIYNLSAAKSYQIIDIANIIKFEYEKRYNKSIHISLNTEDNTIMNNLIVDNTKLKKVLKFEINDMIAAEVNRVFDLLESR